MPSTGVRGILCALCASVALPAAAVSVRDWQVATTEQLAKGTLERVQIDGAGRVALATEFRTLWGPEQGLVWAVAAGDRGGAFVGLSGPGRVVRVSEQGEAETWYEGDEGVLVTALAADGSGGVWAGLSPGGTVIRLDASGEQVASFSTDAEFVWALLRNESGLWAGTGIPGRVLRVDPDTGSSPEPRVVLETGDDPVRCATVAAGGAIVVGTAARGRVIHVDPAGDTFVVLDVEQREIVSVTAGEDGSMLVLAAGAEASPARPARPVRVSPNGQADVTVRVTAGPEPPDGESEPDHPPPPPSRPRPGAGAPGATLYHLGANGDVWPLWQSSGDVPYAVLLDDDGLPLVATGTRGRILRMDRQGQAVRLLRFPSDTVTALARTVDGRLLVGGSGDARLGVLGPQQAAEGHYLSAPHDAGSIAEWGRLNWDVSTAGGGSVTLSVRVGNSEGPDETWSEWFPVRSRDREGETHTGEFDAPPARWAQVRAEFDGGRKGASPWFGGFELRYRPRNRPPRIRELEIEPSGVIFVKAPQPSSVGRGPVVADDIVARQIQQVLQPNRRGPGVVRRSYESGARTFSWKAQDPDGDRLTFALAVRRSPDDAWFPLAGEIRDTFFSWDSRNLPDGVYHLQLTADDAADNPQGQVFRRHRISQPFRVDNTPPRIDGVSAEATAGGFAVEFDAVDPGGRIVAVEYALGAGKWIALDPADGVADAESERYRLELRSQDISEGRLRLRVVDEAGNVGGTLQHLTR